MNLHFVHDFFKTDYHKQSHSEDHNSLLMIRTCWLLTSYLLMSSESSLQCCFLLTECTAYHWCDITRTWWCWTTSSTKCLSAQWARPHISAVLSRSSFSSPLFWCFCCWGFGDCYPSGGIGGMECGGSGGNNYILLMNLEIIKILRMTMMRVPKWRTSSLTV